ncbi:hypothetical protein GGX14DRAFT_357074 [Mycena pura]|uniref:Uncharacterized protein n=1 Tax=Mycena pura TaxID=153505 RepID=A0AAD6VRA2_9AGAR|nr:hypothetical protein GGX14DRAFT_357074 [Mycena pura]
MWPLWARSADPHRLSRLRTTMTVENHWKQVKHTHLHHLVHPRLDQLILWVSSLDKNKLSFDHVWLSFQFQSSVFSFNVRVIVVIHDEFMMNSR